MPTLKKENLKQLAEPLIIEAGILGEKEYRIEKITPAMLKEVKRIADEKLDNGAAKQLAALTGCPEEEFTGSDVRAMTEVLNFLTTEITRGIQEANPSKAEDKS